MTRLVTGQLTALLASDILYKLGIFCKVEMSSTQFLFFPPPTCLELRLSFFNELFHSTLTEAVNSAFMVSSSILISVREDKLYALTT